MYHKSSHLKLQNSEFIFLVYHRRLIKCSCVSKSILVEKELSLDVDAAFLTVTDPNTTDKESYE
jgi:hypothetical protein